MLYLCREADVQREKDSAPGVGLVLIEHLETAWEEPDEGIWEVRGPRRNFTHSKMMAWVAMDRAVKSVERGWRTDAPLEKWRNLRDRIHQEVCTKGFDSEINYFVQFYGSKHLDASLLMMAIVGFLPANDQRVRGTVEAIEKKLLSKDGFVNRYTIDEKVDGLPHGDDDDQGRGDRTLARHARDGATGSGRPAVGTAAPVACLAQLDGRRAGLSRRGGACVRQCGRAAFLSSIGTLEIPAAQLQQIESVKDYRRTFRTHIIQVHGQRT